ncbi:MAG: DNA mismatch repair protein MutS [Chloroflexota bacterium]|nr:DNA mismatch repair protein MutS [Chloroflexota bacterium]MDE2958763.1 DNA mismatch repair protein MutS [Chloroflexota bacterium]
MSTGVGGGRLTPVRRQYLTIKHSYPDAVVLFRMGDFYECFDADAHTLASALEIALTSRTMGKDTRVPMAGVPAVSLETNLARLIKQGHKVAICEQLSDPATSKGLVERGVVRVVTPGTVIETALLDNQANNYLAAVCVSDDRAGLAYVDVTTGEFGVCQMAGDRLPLELARLQPSEILVPDRDEYRGFVAGGEVGEETPVTQLEHAAFSLDTARRTLLEYYGVLSLEAFGLETNGAPTEPLAVRAAGAILEYLQYTWQGERPGLSPPFLYSTASYMTLDPQTRRNLELFAAGRWDSSDTSLLKALDGSRTPMGARLLRRWLGQPLLDLERLERRLDAVQFFHDDAFRRDDAASALAQISDLERILSRVQTNTATPRDLLALQRSVEAAAELGAALSRDDDQQVAWLAGELRPITEVTALIEQAIEPEPSGSVGEGGVIRPGFAPELDRTRGLSRDARGFIAGLESEERERTGIRNLKVGFNQVFGYYIEVSKSNLDAVPDHYQRRQTLTGGERYITPELKEFESQALDAREKLGELERSLYRQVCRQIADHGPAISRLASAIARADVFVGLADVAVRHGYVRPELNDGVAIRIADGRHPVVERVLGSGGFVPNDAALDSDDAQIMLITGPNMAGKSTYIRQVAIIVLMAQVGSFVPASSAAIGLVDRIFTRVGLQDDLATGQSTFMVEMVETAAILNQASWRSLVILDEIGRGTSTYDGLSIARAVVEHLHNNPRLGCKTLFATHYHELTELASTLPGVRNYSVAVSEEDGRVAFLRRIVPGGADRSYGVHVAMLAGMPASVVSRAQELLTHLEQDRGSNVTAGRGERRKSDPSPQLPLPLFPSGHERLTEALLEMDVSNLTPLEAINKLYELQEQARRPEE